MVEITVWRLFWSLGMCLEVQLFGVAEGVGSIWTSEDDVIV